MTDALTHGLRRRERKYGLNDGSLDRVVRFAMVFCAAREKRCLERVKLVDEVSR